MDEARDSAKKANAAHHNCKRREERLRTKVSHLTEELAEQRLISAELRKRLDSFDG